jgi:hydrogenase-4 component B
MLVLIAMALSAVSGLPGIFMARASAGGQRAACGLMCAAALAGLTGACMGLRPGLAGSCAFPWPAAGNAMIGLDALSAFFLVPVFLFGGLGSIYGLGYWPQERHPGSARKLQAFWGLAVAGMGLLLVGKHALAFMLGWEIMALSAFFLITAEDRESESRRAGFIYLIATHLGTLTLFGMFALWRWATGSFALEPIAAEAADIGALNALFFLALVGFGLKAGVMPLHFWLPGAHANAPSHVSAMLSGVMLKMGIYGLVRFLFLLPAPPASWGGLVLGLGALSGLLGVVFAIGQHDIKRLLAYHSIENIGIILMGLGLAMLGRSAGRDDWLVLGLGGCLLHVWNHSLFKSLLFLGAGSVVRGARTRRIDLLGGLARSMPWTAAMFLVGAVAICGLPPLNGFVSELLVYLGLFGTAAIPGGKVSAAVVAAPILAMIGALALACFVKVYGIVFLGSPRRPDSVPAPESPACMLAPMLFLAGCCVAIGCAAALLGPPLDSAIAAASSALPRELPRVAALAPLTAVSIASGSAIAVIASIAAFQGLRARRVRRAPTWDCGYASPDPRMQYTASSFARTIESMFAWALRPRERVPLIEGPFPQSASMESHVDDAVLDRLIVPAARWTQRLFGWFRRFQQGLTQHYILYVLVALALLLGTLIPFGDLISRLFER